MVSVYEYVQRMGKGLCWLKKEHCISKDIVSVYSDNHPPQRANEKGTEIQASQILSLSLSHNLGWNVHSKLRPERTPVLLNSRNGAALKALSSDYRCEKVDLEHHMRESSYCVKKDKGTSTRT